MLHTFKAKLAHLGQFAITSALLVTASSLPAQTAPELVPDNPAVQALNTSDGALVYIDGLEVFTSSPQITGFEDALERLDPEDVIASVSMLEIADGRPGHFTVMFAHRWLILQSWDENRRAEFADALDGDLATASSVVLHARDPAGSDTIFVFYIVEDTADPLPGACYARHLRDFIYTGAHSPIDPADCPVPAS